VWRPSAGVWFVIRSVDVERDPREDRRRDHESECRHRRERDREEHDPFM
jgi:hypothetical protein